MPVVMKREKFSKSSSRLNSGILIERSSREFYYVEGHSVRDQASFEQIWGWKIISGTNMRAPEFKLSYLLMIR